MTTAIQLTLTASFLPAPNSISDIQRKKHCGHAVDSIGLPPGVWGGAGHSSGSTTPPAPAPVRNSNIQILTDAVSKVHAHEHHYISVCDAAINYFHIYLSEASGHISSSSCSIHSIRPLIQYKYVLPRSLCFQTGDAFCRKTNIAQLQTSNELSLVLRSRSDCFNAMAAAGCLRRWWTVNDDV